MRHDLNLNTVTLWGMWYTKYGPTTMQGWKGCDQLQQHQTITLTDARDDNQYTVSKLKDGNCWMVDNLKIGGNEEIELTPQDSNLSYSYLLPKAGDRASLKENNDNNNAAFSAYYLNGGGGNYNWFTATGGSTIVSGESASSICPKRWRLPRNEEHINLVNVYGSGLMSPPLNYSSGWWWTSTAETLSSGKVCAHEFWFGSGSTGCNSRSWGWRIRCVRGI